MPSASITTIGIITADRPASAYRALESLVRHGAAQSARARFLVIDGSRKPANLVGTRQVVTSVVRASGHRVDYVGPRESAEFFDRLGLHDASARVPLTPGATGANRNLFLLMTAGEHALMVDDDVICETWASTARADGLALMGHDQELFETEFFPDRAAALASVARTNVNLIAADQTLLGQSLAGLMTSSRPADVTNACGHLRKSLDDGRTLVVKATFAGIAGDAGVYCPYRFLFSSGPLRDRLRSNPPTLSTALTSREVSRIVRTNTVTHDNGCMATCMGVANTAVVPPFLPINRNEDGVFGVMLSAADEAAVFGHVPVGVLHDSNRPSHRPEGVVLSATQTRVAEVTLGVLRARADRDSGVSSDQWFQSVGNAFTELGRIQTSDLAAFVIRTILEGRALEIAALERDASEPDCPAPWRAVLDKYHGKLSRSMTRPEFCLPAEFHGTGSVDAGYEALQAFLQTFGQLVSSWPALWAAAHRLNTNT